MTSPGPRGQGGCHALNSIQSGFLAVSETSQLIPTLGPLHSLIPLPKRLFPQISTWSGPVSSLEPFLTHPKENGITSCCCLPRCSEQWLSPTS